MFRTALAFSMMIILAGAVCGTAEAKPDDALKEFTEIREAVQKEMAEKGKASGPFVEAALGEALKILNEEQERADAGRNRKQLKASIKLLTILQRRAGFISPTNELRINENLALAESRLIAHLVNQGRSVT